MKKVTKRRGFVINAFALNGAKLTDKEVLISLTEKCVLYFRVELFLWCLMLNRGSNR